jgi:hypothetical protein
MPLQMSDHLAMGLLAGLSFGCGLGSSHVPAPTDLKIKGMNTSPSLRPWIRQDIPDLSVELAWLPAVFALGWTLRSVIVLACLDVCGVDRHHRIGTAASNSN